MPVKLLHPLRFIIPSSFSPVARCLPIKLRSPVPSSAAAYPILSRPFTFRLNHRFVGGMAPRRFSTVPDAPGADTRSTKSLMDDEAELDSWVSSLTGPGRKEGAESGPGWDRSRSSTAGAVRDRGGDSGGFKRPRDGGDFGERDSRAKVSNFGTRPPFGSDRKYDGRGRPGDFKNSQRGSWGNKSNPRRRSRFGSDFEDDDDEDDDDEDEDDEELYRSPAKGGLRGGMNSGRMSSRGGRRGGGRNGGMRTNGERDSRSERRSRFGSDLEDDDDEDDDDDDEYKSPARGGFRGMDMSRGGRGRGGRGRGGRNGGMRTNGERDSRSERRSRFGSDLEDDDDEDDDDEDDEDDDDDDDVYKSPARGGFRGMDMSRGGRGRGGRGRGGRNGGMRTIEERGSRGGRRSRFGSDFEDDDDDDEDDGDEDEDDEEVHKSPKKGGLSGLISGPMSRGGPRGRGGNGGMRTNGGRGFGRGARFASSLVSGDHDGEEEEPLTSLKHLVSQDSASDDSEDDTDFDQELQNERSLPPARTNAVPRVSSSPGGSDSYLSESRFDQCSISPLSLKAIKDAGYEKMTIVQEATLPVILKGKDVLAKARTGTGKTVAFLLPSIEVIVKSPPAGLDQKRPPITVLVICPTRELACQAATEANTLLKYHPSIGVQVVIGGTRLALEQKRMQTNPCQILVGTPGRLKDHIENTPGFATRLRGVNVLVLDEADHLLDMGFRKDIETIIAAVPKQRQTLLFSATVPAEVRQICHIALKRDHEFINTVEEGSEETHSQVKQMHLIAPLDKQFPLIYALLKEHISDDVDYKVLVFCTTAMVTRMVADFLGELHLNVREIHSRKPQSYRTRISDEFRKSKSLILVTSDVSARGVDYPDVTLVIQVGAPSNRQQYVHRLGRTGRKGKEGQGILLLAPWEEFFLSEVKDLPLTKAPEPMVDPDMKKKVERALSHVEMKNKEAAYQAWLGYYNSNQSVGRNKNRLVELASDFSRSMGLDRPPAIPKMVLGKMGLKNVPGLRSK